VTENFLKADFMAYVTHSVKKTEIKLITRDSYALHVLAIV